MLHACAVWMESTPLFYGHRFGEMCELSNRQTEPRRQFYTLALPGTITGNVTRISDIKPLQDTEADHSMSGIANEYSYRGPGTLISSVSI